jgi:heme/copper-type cytochrome/quinol oxidase subunit 3
MHLAVRRTRAGDDTASRMFLGLTLILGATFLTLQGFEYHAKLGQFGPRENAYATMFYTITSFHAAHLILGLLMLCYVFALPEIGPARKPPHRALHNAGLYWHFVDLIWVVVVVLLYVVPNIRR